MLNSVSGGNLPNSYKFAQVHFHWGSSEDKGKHLNSKIYWHKILFRFRAFSGWVSLCNGNAFSPLQINICHNWWFLDWSSKWHPCCTWNLYSGIFLPKLFFTLTKQDWSEAYMLLLKMQGNYFWNRNTLSVVTFIQIIESCCHISNLRMFGNQVNEFIN